MKKIYESLMSKVKFVAFIAIIGQRADHRLDSGFHRHHRSILLFRHVHCCRQV